MWPFSKKTSDKPSPSLKVGETLITWDIRFDWWEFEIDGVSYLQSENPVFDPQIIKELPKVRQWINDLDAEFDREIAKQLDGWCEWDGKKDLGSIEVSCLLEKNQVDVAFSGSDDWGDLGVNIIITAGKIEDVYSGD